MSVVRGRGSGVGGPGSWVGGPGSGGPVGPGVRAAGLEVGAQRAPRLLVLRYFLRFQDYQEDTNFHDNNQFCDNDITDR